MYLPFLAGLGYLPLFLGQLSLKVLAISLTSGFIQTIYFICLIKAYRMADLSLVYPISRSAPLFTQIWAFLLIGEIVSFQGIVGISLVILGIFVTSIREFHSRRVIPSFHASRRPYFLALAAALAGSVYVVFDKAGVQILHPLLFGCLINLWMCTFIGLYTWRHKETSLLKSMARVEKRYCHDRISAKCGIHTHPLGSSMEQGKLRDLLPSGRSSLWSAHGNPLPEGESLEDPAHRSNHSYLRSCSHWIGKVEKWILSHRLSVRCRDS